jgi:hypothetical protein
MKIALMHLKLLMKKLFQDLQIDNKFRFKIQILITKRMMLREEQQKYKIKNMILTKYWQMMNFVYLVPHIDT